MPHTLPRGLLLAAFGATFVGVVTAGRDGVNEQNAKLHRDGMLKVENTYLHQEVNELRTELRMAASGHFIREHKASPASSLAQKEQLAESKLHSNLHEVSVKSVETASSDIEAKQVLSADMQDISEAIAQDAATVARTLDTKHGKSGSAVQAHGKNNSNSSDLKVLFILHSKSKFYDTRIRWARDTWAKNLASSQLLVIGDGEAKDLPGVIVHQTRCKPYDDTMGMCKYAEAVVVAQSMMWQNPEIEWVYMADDDSYIRAAALEHALFQQPASHPHDRGVVLGSYGCATANCSDLLCGGSGYAANRWAIEILAGGDPAGFVQEMMRNGNRCGGDVANNRGLWGDAGLSETIKDRGIERRTLNGIYGWMLDKSCLEFSLESEKEPLMYHMIRSKSQMDLLHRLFTPLGEQTGSAAPASSSTVQDGLGGCVDFRGNVQCAASRDDEDRPWHSGPSLCKRPHMPRLPVLLGVVILLMLFGILVTFIWAGTKHEQWEGWKLQGMKFHSHPLQGHGKMFR